VLASPLNKNIFVVRLGRLPAGRQGSAIKFDGLRQALTVVCNPMRIIINFLFPLLFIAAIILVIYAITFSISSIKSKSTKGRKRALLLGLCSFVFLAASLTLFTFKKRSVKHKIIAKLHGSYFYFDSSKNDISNRDPLNQPRLDLKADMSFSFHVPSIQDSVVSGVWHTDPESHLLKLSDQTGKLLWTPLWDTMTTPTNLLFKQGGDIVVYHKLE